MTDKDNLTPEAVALFDMHGKGDPGQKERDPLQELVDKFDRELAGWNSRIHGMTERMKDIAKCTDVQSELYDSRHEIVDGKHKLLRSLAKFNQRYKELHAERLRHYTTNSDRKYTTAERELLIEGDLAGQKYRIELLENHLNHIDQIFKLIDHMLYGIKNRISLEEYIRKI